MPIHHRIFPAASWFIALALLILSGTAMAQPTGSPAAERIKTNPDPYEPFLLSQAIRAGNLVFVSGQVGMDLQGKLVGVGNFEAQAEQAFKMLGMVLEQAGSSLHQTVKVNIYVTDMKNFPVVMKLREKYFKKPYPADTIVQVSALALPELQIEIDAVGLVGGTIQDAR
jgi:reactive intermediate/imine deaminase